MQDTNILRTSIGTVLDISDLSSVARHKHFGNITMKAA